MYLCPKTDKRDINHCGSNPADLSFPFIPWSIDLHLVMTISACPDLAEHLNSDNVTASAKDLMWQGWRALGWGHLWLMEGVGGWIGLQARSYWWQEAWHQQSEWVQIMKAVIMSAFHRLESKTSPFMREIPVPALVMVRSKFQTVDFAIFWFGPLALLVQ